MVSARASLRFVLPMAACATFGCGYQSARKTTPEQGWCVEAGSDLSSYPQALSAATSAMRDALAQRGALAASCRQDRVLLVGVVRVHAEAAGIVASRDTTGDLIPSARATRVSVTISIQQAGSTVREVTEHALVASQASSLEQENAMDTGSVVAARRAGDRLVRTMTGEPGPW